MVTEHCREHIVLSLIRTVLIDVSAKLHVSDNILPLPSGVIHKTILLRLRNQWRAGNMNNSWSLQYLSVVPEYPPSRLAPKRDVIAILP